MFFYNNNKIKMEEYENFQTLELSFKEDSFVSWEQIQNLINKKINRATKKMDRDLPTLFKINIILEDFSTEFEPEEEDELCFSFASSLAYCLINQEKISTREKRLSPPKTMILPYVSEITKSKIVNSILHFPIFNIETKIYYKSRTNEGEGEE